MIAAEPGWATRQELERYVTARLAVTLDIPAWQLDPASELRDLGAGPSEIVELLAEVRTDLGMSAGPEEFAGVRTVGQLVDRLAVLIGPDRTRSGAVRPLSVGQRALWFLHRLSPDASAYNVSRAIRIAGDGLDPVLASELMQQIVQRHPVLRTRYQVVDGEPVQVVDDRPVADFAVVEGRSLDDREVAEWLRHETSRPFDLATGPVVRARMLRNHDGAILVVCGHHIALDMWSMLLIGRELLLLYGARQAGLPVPATPAADYADFVRWQASWMDGDGAARAWDYWRRELAGELPTLRLPQDRPRPAVLAYRGSSHQFWIDADVTRRLRELATAERTTMFVVLLAAYQAVLQRYSGQDDVIVAAPMSGRARREFEDVVGYFVNMVLLRAGFHAGLTFRTHLHRVRRSVVGALEHQDYPFPALVQRLQPTRDLGSDPFLRAAFTLQKATGFEGEGFAPFVVGPVGDGGPPVEVGDLTLAMMSLDLTAVQADLTLMAVESGDRLLASLQYNTDLFDAATIVRLGGALRTLFADVVADPDRPVARLALLDGDERRLVVGEWNGTGTGAVDDCCVHELVEAQVDRTPDAVAVKFGDRSLTYRALDEQANAVAARLVAAGIGPGARVALCLDRSAEMVVGVLGVLKAGGAYVPLDPDTPTERLQTMARTARLAAVLTSCRRVDTVLPLSAAAGNDVEVVLLDGPTALGSCARRPATGVTPEDPAYVIFTSGSTGQPKGTVNLHAAVVNHLRWRQATFALRRDDHVLQKTPYTFDVSVWELFLPLSTGGLLVVAAPGGHLDPAYLKATIEREQISVVHFVPSMLEVFVAEPDLSGCTSLRYVMCGGESLTESLQRRFFDRFDLDLQLCYGPTETCIAVTYLRCGRGNLRRGVRIGRPIANTAVYILDTYGEPVPIGVIGEIYIGGRPVGGGYLDDPVLTAQRFVPDPFATRPGARMYRTGDLGQFLPDGCIEFIGRRDSQVKVRGFRIELGDVEAALRSHSAVREAIVRIDTRAGDVRLVGYVAPETSAPDAVDVGQLRRHLERLLPHYMVPTAFVVLERFPLGPTGKISVERLPAPDLAPADREVVAPRTPTEARIAAVWERLLGVAPIGATDDFFAIGGHSLLAVRLSTALEAEFDHAVPVSIVVGSPTVERLAAALAELPRRSAGRSWSPVVALRAGRPDSTMWWVHPSGGTVLCYHDLAARLDPGWSLYALEARGLRGEAPPHRTIEEMAACYVEAVEAREPDGPVVLGGWSLGGVIAFEMGRQLLGRGRDVGRVLLVDAPAPAHADDPDRADPGSPEPAGPSTGDPLLDIVAAGAVALRYYRAAPVPFPVTLFCGTQWPGFDTVDGWRRLCDRPEVQLITGGHHDLLREPYVVELAQAVDRTLNTRAEAR